MIKPSDQESEIIKDMFNEYDTNHNGLLDREEFFRGFKKLIKRLSEEQDDETLNRITEEAILRFDLDKNGQIDPYEFTELILFLVDEKGLSLLDQ